MGDLLPFVVLGLAFGGVYSLSGVGTVVLFRATAVLNLASGAVGAFGALLAWTLIVENGVPQLWGFLAAIGAGTGITVLWGVLLGPRFAARDGLEKAIGTLGLMLVLLGTMSLVWGSDARALTLPSTAISVEVAGAYVTGTQIIAIVLALVATVVTTLFLRFTRLGTAMRAMADDREVTSMLGVPVRRVEAAAWFVSGLLSSVTGLLMTGLVGLDVTSLTFLIIPALAAAVVGRLRSLWVTFGTGFAIGVVQSCLTSFDAVSEYRNTTPFLLAIVMLLWLAWRRPLQTRV
ncbi:branched-chain amino acid ABC transporter permease [Nocardioides sp. GY 10127]|uniref:branched-chain amino acid ABC transporter permease n=1 Tax=Nocardioides sp. GY 10127 TaxID=2569762 RepID=UPI0010A93875|nr:branched-chain amino acid ABC transporter permease [Nocardioides sp. GY 10127]TIC79995.1 branched-chain amino acid ABC transporter permease [Nocardioides sp. GY 10127]